jgi:putative NADH-flavin reductase
MKLALLGATGLTGPSVLAEALARGHDVVALARNPNAITKTHEHLAVVPGNALLAHDLDKCLDGCDAVLHCLGVGGRGDGKATTLCADSVSLLLPVMKARGVRRLIVMSNLWASGSGAWVMRKVAIPVFAPWLAPILRDKEKMEAILHASDVEWVAPRFPGIVEGPPKPTKTENVGLKITTGSVATFMLDQLADTPHLRGTPSVSN